MEEGEKGLLRTITTRASTSALFLGLVLTSVTLYDFLVAKPGADRVARLSQFNQAVNSASKVRQDLMLLQAQTADPQLQMSVASFATPQVLNNLSTAKALLRGMSDNDVEIPQLVVLISEALNFGDLQSAEEFVGRAVRKTNVTPYLRSEARRFQAKYLFLTGAIAKGRDSFENSLDSLGTSEGFAAARSFVLADYALAEFTHGDCARATAQFKRLVHSLSSAGVPAQARSQIVTSVAAQLNQAQAFHCPLTEELAATFTP